MVYCFFESYLFVCPFSRRLTIRHIKTGEKVVSCLNSPGNCAVLSLPIFWPFSLIFPILLRVWNPLILNRKPSLSHIFMYLFALFVILFQI